MDDDLTIVDDLPSSGDGGGHVPRRRRRRAVPVAVAIGLVVVAAVAVIATGGASPSDDLVAGGRAPMFDLARVGAPNQRVTLAQFSRRPVVVNFWASWCVPCRKEMPALQAVSARLDGRVQFVGVNHKDGRTFAARFEREVGVRYPSGWNPDGDVARRYDVVGLPTTILVDRSGNIVARHLGKVTERHLLDLIGRAFGPSILGSAA